MRMLHLFNKEFQENRKGLIIYFATVFIILLFPEVIGAAMVRFTRSAYETSYAGSFPGFLFLGGFIVTSVFFTNDMFSKKGQHNWLMLPASSTEKFLAKAIITAGIYPLAITALFTISSLLIETILLVVFHDPFTMFSPFTSAVGWMLLHYVVTQSVFLLGATYFRKAHFIKTILSIGLLAIFIGLIAALFARIAFAPYFSGLFRPMECETMVALETIPGQGTLEVIMNILYWGLLAPFCWCVSYLRVKEVQATDAIQ
ncbi:MAG: hypothetical protein AB9828_08490 [Sphaerochaetaceae bacterium]